MKKYLRPLLIILLIFIILLALWFILKPLRVAKANQYLNSESSLSYQKAAILTPLSPLVHLKIGQMYEKVGNLKDAEKEFNKISFICKIFAWKNKNLQSCPEYKEGYFYLKKINARNALNRGNINEAGTSLAEALKINPSDLEAKFYYAIFLTNQSEYQLALDNLKLQLKNNKLEKQRETLFSSLKQIQSASSNPYKLLLTGTTFLKIGYTDLAIQQFDKAKNLEPNYRDAYVLLGSTYLEKGDLGKAKEYLEQAAKIDPIYPTTFHLLSKTYEKLEKPDEAKKAFEKAEILGWGK